MFWWGLIHAHLRNASILLRVVNSSMLASHTYLQSGGGGDGDTKEMKVGNPSLPHAFSSIPCVNLVKECTQLHNIPGVLKRIALYGIQLTVHFYQFEGRLKASLFSLPLSNTYCEVREGQIGGRNHSWAFLSFSFLNSYSIRFIHFLCRSLQLWNGC